MKAWWLGLNQREQQLVSALGVFVIIFILYQAIWLPLNQSVEKYQQKIENQQELFTWMNQEIARYQALSGGQKRPVSSGSISSIVNQAAARTGITITRIQPQGDDLQVWIENVAFNVLLQWLEGLANQQGLVIKNIDLDSGDSAGEVRVRRLQLGKA
ncbi:type II secretion system protein GspM [Thalassotalea ganghwensis]